jgi:glycosyltransferase involved in cell wall biosynthesis
MISFIVPAHNEEAWVGRCVSAIHSALEAVREEYEIIVADDSSTDATSSVAHQHGARVIRVEHQQISATRNAGAREARGEVLFFVDADTLVSAAVIQSALRSIRDGAVGGGCVPRFEGWLPLWWRLAYPFIVGVVRVLSLPGGACQFCTRAAFEATGGFSENHYAAEDALFVGALKRHGRFVVLAEPVITSGRSLRAHSFLSIARVLVRFAFHGPNAFRKRHGLDLWYHPKREKVIMGLHAPGDRLPPASP